MKRTAIVLTAVLLAAGSTACAGPRSPASDAMAPVAGPVAAPQPAQQAPASIDLLAAAPAAVAPGLPVVIVHKSPTCGCCGLWVEHMRSAGFQVEVRNSDDLNPIKQSLGVPADKASCHTAQVGDYFVEGHVPAEDVKRLLAQHPAGRGLAVPGMPLGSPGMEMPDGSAQPYSVELIASDGSSTNFASH